MQNEIHSVDNPYIQTEYITQQKQTNKNQSQHWALACTDVCKQMSKLILIGIVVIAIMSIVITTITLTVGPNAVVEIIHKSQGRGINDALTSDITARINEMSNRHMERIEANKEKDKGDGNDKRKDRGLNNIELPKSITITEKPRNRAKQIRKEEEEFNKEFERKTEEMNNRMGLHFN